MPRPRSTRKPPLTIFTTTLWEYPSQHYVSPRGMTEQGDRDYVGATPSWVIWQTLMRYTREGDLVVDPMAGSGTTIDVARDLNRRALGYDLVPHEDRKGDIFRADARKLPLEDAVADFVFVDPPYSTHINYSDDPNCIGKLDAGAPAAENASPAFRTGSRASRTATRSRQTRTGSAAGTVAIETGVQHQNAYYAAMEQVIREIHRILKNRRYMALYVSDSWRKKKGGPPGSGGGEFMPIGFELFSILRRYFTPIDIIVVVRHNAKLKKGNWHKVAREQNFFLRGFNYLFIMKKVEQ